MNFDPRPVKYSNLTRYVHYCVYIVLYYVYIYMIQCWAPSFLQTTSFWSHMCSRLLSHLLDQSDWIGPSRGPFEILVWTGGNWRVNSWLPNTRLWIISYNSKGIQYWSWWMMVDGTSKRLCFFSSATTFSLVTPKSSTWIWLNRAEGISLCLVTWKHTKHLHLPALHLPALPLAAFPIFTAHCANIVIVMTLSWHYHNILIMSFAMNTSLFLGLCLLVSSKSSVAKWRNLRPRNGGPCWTLWLEDCLGVKHCMAMGQIGYEWKIKSTAFSKQFVYQNSRPPRHPATGDVMLELGSQDHLVAHPPWRLKHWRTLLLRFLLVLVL